MNKEHMKADAEKMASIIISDLNIGEDTLDFAFCWRLCQEHGCEPMVIDGFRQGRGLYLEETPHDSGEGYIILSSDLTLKEACAVMIHELAHRLTMGPRYEAYNRPNFQSYPRGEWRELLARTVERHFLEAGGTGPRSISELN